MHLSIIIIGILVAVSVPALLDRDGRHYQIYKTLLRIIGIALVILGLLYPILFKC